MKPFAILLVLALAHAWVLKSPSRRDVLIQLRSTESSASEVDSKLQKLLQKAAKLRQEAQALEDELRQSQSVTRAHQPAVPTVQPGYKDIKDSIWEFSYRFADRPESDDDDAHGRIVYSGKVSLKFRDDGYTDLLSQKPRKNGIEITKAWGWDVEVSNDDDKEYIMFSIDASTPERGELQRYYFQARLERTNDIISLKEGTVTVKQDVVDSKTSAGVWGLFSPRGILAQFRYVGDFVASPHGMSQ